MQNTNERLLNIERRVTKIEKAIRNENITNEFLGFGKKKKTQYKFSGKDGEKWADQFINAYKYKSLMSAHQIENDDYSLDEIPMHVTMPVKYPSKAIFEIIYNEDNDSVRCYYSSNSDKAFRSKNGIRTINDDYIEISNPFSDAEKIHKFIMKCLGLKQNQTKLAESESYNRKDRFNRKWSTRKTK